MSQANGTANARRPLKELKEERARLKLENEIAQERGRQAILAKHSKFLESIWRNDAWEDDFDRERLLDVRRSTLNVVPSMPTDRQAGKNFPIWETQQDLDRLRQQSRIVTTLNAFAGGMLDNLVSYAIGKGFNYRAAPKDQKKLRPGVQADANAKMTAANFQAFVDGFCERNRWNCAADPFDPHNKPFGATLEQQAYRRTHRDGETLIRSFYNEDGTTDIRLCEPELLRDPPGKTWQDGWSFGIKHWVDGKGGADVERREQYHFVSPEQREVEGEYVPASEIVHILNGRDDTAIKRGTPTFAFDTLDALERAAKLQRNMSASAAFRAATAEYWEQEFGTQDQINSMRTGLSERTVTNPITGGTEYLERLMPGAVRRGSTGQKLVPMPANTGVPEHLQAAQGDLRQAGCRVAAPEYLVSGDASNANFASTKEAGTPFVLGAEREQEQFKAAFLAVILRAAKHAMRKGKLPSNTLDVCELQVEAPKIEQRDPLAVGQTDQILAGLGKSSQTILMEHGLDPDIEAKNKQEWDDRFGGQAALPMPGPSAGAPKPRLPSAVPSMESLRLLCESDDAFGRKVAKLRGEGKPEDQALAIAYSMQRRGELHEEDEPFPAPAAPVPECGGPGGKPGPCPTAGPDTPAGDSLTANADPSTKADAIVSDKSLWQKIKRLPANVARKAIDAGKGLYAKAEAKYGPRWAKAIVATAIVTMPTPFTMGSVAAMTGLAHLWTRYISGGPKRLGEGAEGTMTQEEIEAAAAEFLRELLAGLEMPEEEMAQPLQEAAEEIVEVLERDENGLIVGRRSWTQPREEGGNGPQP